MTYKNGVKEYVLTGVLFGVPMGILFGIIYFDLFLGIFSAILCGLLYTLLIFAFLKFQEKKYDKMRIEIAKERRIICDGAATVYGNGGWMFLTEMGIEFRPHKINFSTNDIMIPISIIKTVQTKRNRLVINTTDYTVSVIVTHSKEWKKQIEDALAAHS